VVRTNMGSTDVASGLLFIQRETPDGNPAVVHSPRLLVS
jgi:hypothetical protein